MDEINHLWGTQGDVDYEHRARGDLTAKLEFTRVHDQDRRHGREPQAHYHNLDLTLQTRGYHLPVGWRERPWRVFFDVGLRKVLPRGRPREIEPEEIAEYLPAQLELGCGPSIEAGIPHLSNLHRIYGVSRADALTFSASIVSPCFSSPPPRILTPSNFPRTRFAARKDSSFTTEPLLNSFRSDKFTIA